MYTASFSCTPRLFLRFVYSNSVLILDYKTKQKTNRGLMRRRGHLAFLRLQLDDHVAQRLLSLKKARCPRRLILAQRELRIETTTMRLNWVSFTMVAMLSCVLAIHESPYDAVIPPPSPSPPPPVVAGPTCPPPTLPSPPTPPTPPTPPPLPPMAPSSPMSPPPCASEVDLVLVLDNSQSVGSERGTVINFARAVVGQFKMGPAAAQVTTR